MIQNRRLLSRVVLTTLVVVPLGIMGILTVTVLLPALKDPESKFYASGIGYPAQQRKAGKAIQVKAVPVALKSLEDSVAAPGESVALQEVDVRPLVSGTVEKVYVIEGELVQRGQRLMKIEQVPFQERVKTARNDVVTAENDFQTLESSTPARLFALKENVKIAKTRLAEAKNKLKEINSLAEQEVKNNVEAAQTNLETAEKKLKEVRVLVEVGGMSRFQLYDMEGIYATRKKELLAAQQGVIITQNLLLNNRDFYISRQNDLISAQQALDIAQKNLDRDIKNARLTLENAKISLENALRDLNKTVIYASTDGLVSQVNIHSGEVADVRSPNSLMTLTENIVFKAYIDQARLNAVKIGDKATVRLVAYPGRTFQGRVTRLNPTVQTNAVTRIKVGFDRQYTYSVWVAVDGLQMSPGLQGYVQFDQGKTSLVIPESAVTHLSAGEGMVMVAESGKAVVKKVKLGRIFDNQREVLAGLEIGEQVIPSARALNPGDLVEVVPMQ